jgi:hypothetical protein
VTPPSTPAESGGQGQASGGFARLSRRIGGWTANLLATAIVLVAGLAIGRQIMIWWHEAAPPQPVEAAAKGDLPEAAPAEIRWWTARGPLTVEHIQGNQAAVLAAMRRRCLEAPIGQIAGQWTAPAGPGEERYVARLANERPVEQTEDLDLHEPRGGPTMVVAVARRQRRIAAWSFALPDSAGGSSWSCYTIHAAGIAGEPAARIPR